MDSLPNRMNKNKSPPSNTIGISNSIINSNTNSMSNNKSSNISNTSNASSSSSGSGSGSGRGVNRMDGESSVCDGKNTYAYIHSCSGHF